MSSNTIEAEFNPYETVALNANFYMTNQMALRLTSALWAQQAAHFTLLEALESGAGRPIQPDALNAAKAQARAASKSIEDLIMSMAGRDPSLKMVEGE